MDSMASLDMSSRFVFLQKETFYVWTPAIKDVLLSKTYVSFYASLSTTALQSGAKCFLAMTFLGLHTVPSR